MLPFASLISSTSLRNLAAALLALGGAGLVQADSPPVLVTTPDALSAVRTLAGTFAEIAELKTSAPCDPQAHDLLLAQAGKLREARLLVVSPRNQEPVTCLWCERLAMHGIPTVQLADCSVFQELVAAQRLCRLHAALTAVLPEFRPELDRALQRELRQLHHHAQNPEWAHQTPRTDASAASPNRVKLVIGRTTGQPAEFFGRPPE